MTRTTTLKIGTRASPLALRQASMARDRALEAFPSIRAELVKIKTAGDKVTDRPLFAIGGKGLFTKELEDRLLDGSIDVAVHSLKDLPVDLPPGLIIGAVLPRGPSADALVTLDGRGLEGLPQGARVGTSSLRRRAQILAARPDLLPCDLRGNLDTRIRKLADGEMDGFVAARAGLDRLGALGPRVAAVDLPGFVPAPGQGAIAIEARSGRPELRDLLRALMDADTDRLVRAERAFLAGLGGGCHVPIGALAVARGPELRLVGLVISPDGKRSIRREAASEGDPESLGAALAREALEAGAAQLLASEP